MSFTNPVNEFHEFCERHFAFFLWQVDGKSELHTAQIQATCLSCFFGAGGLLNNLVSILFDDLVCCFGFLFVS